MGHSLGTVEWFRLNVSFEGQVQPQRKAFGIFRGHKGVERGRICTLRTSIEKNKNGKFCLLTKQSSMHSMRFLSALLMTVLLTNVTNSLRVPVSQRINSKVPQISDSERQVDEMVTFNPNRGGGGSFGRFNCVRLRGGGSPSPLRFSYSSLQQSNPLLMTMLLSSFVAIVGDVLSQTLTGSRDFHRVVIFALLGGLFFGPVLHYWYGIIGRFGVKLEKNHPTMPKGEWS